MEGVRGHLDLLAQWRGRPNAETIPSPLPTDVPAVLALLDAETQLPLEQQWELLSTLAEANAIDNTTSVTFPRTGLKATGVDLRLYLYYMLDKQDPADRVMRFLQATAAVVVSHYPPGATAPVTTASMLDAFDYDDFDSRAAQALAAVAEDATDPAALQNTRIMHLGLYGSSIVAYGFAKEYKKVFRLAPRYLDLTMQYGEQADGQVMPAIIDASDNLESALDYHGQALTSGDLRLMYYDCVADLESQATTSALAYRGYASLSRGALGATLVALAATAAASFAFLRAQTR